MYKVFIEDLYQIESIEDLCSYHNYNFSNNEEHEFLKIFSTKEDAQAYIEKTFTEDEDSWYPFIVHTENGEVIDIDGKIPEPPIHNKEELIKYNNLFHTNYEYEERGRYIALYKDGSRKYYDTEEEIVITDDVICVFID